MAYYFYGTNASESIYGTSSHDVIYGYGGNDYLYGGFGNDHLYGGSGDDDLVGGSGINTLYGGGGYDWFIMSARSTSSSDDLIADFEFGYDKIDVSAWGVSDFSQIKAILGSVLRRCAPQRLCRRLQPRAHRRRRRALAADRLGLHL